MKSLFVEFLESPSRDSYQALRAALLTDESYNPYSDELSNVGEYLQVEQLERARELLFQAMPNLLLSPRAHQMLAFIADRLGDFATRNVEATIAEKLCEGILASGDGTQSNPHFVSRPSDQYDVLGYLGKKALSQSLHEVDAAQLDCVTCEDGTLMWFDVTDQLSRLAS